MRPTSFHRYDLRYRRRNAHDVDFHRILLRVLAQKDVSGGHKDALFACRTPEVLNKNDNVAASMEVQVARPRSTTHRKERARSSLCVRRD